MRLITLVSLSLRLKDLLRPATRVKKKKTSREYRGGGVATARVLGHGERRLHGEGCQQEVGSTSARGR